MNIFSELYIKHLARTLFFISIGVSSSIGQFLLTKNILRDDFLATVIAVLWASLLILIYSWFRAEREHQYKMLAESFNYHRTLRPDNRIGAIASDPLVQPKDLNVPKTSDSYAPPVSKVEFVHSLEEPAQKEPWPRSELKDKDKK